MENLLNKNLTFNLFITTDNDESIVFYHKFEQAINNYCYEFPKIKNSDNLFENVQKYVKDNIGLDVVGINIASKPAYINPSESDSAFSIIEVHCKGEVAESLNAECRIITISNDELLEALHNKHKNFNGITDIVFKTTIAEYITSLEMFKHTQKIMDMIYSGQDVHNIGKKNNEPKRRSRNEHPFHVLSNTSDNSNN